MGCMVYHTGCAGVITGRRRQRGVEAGNRKHHHRQMVQSCRYVCATNFSGLGKARTARSEWHARGYDLVTDNRAARQSPVAMPPSKIGPVIARAPAVGPSVER